MHSQWHNSKTGIRRIPYNGSLKNNIRSLKQHHEKISHTTQETSNNNNNKPNILQPTYATPLNPIWKLLLSMSIPVYHLQQNKSMKETKIFQWAQSQDNFKTTHFRDIANLHDLRILCHKSFILRPQPAYASNIFAMNFLLLEVGLGALYFKEHNFILSNLNMGHVCLHRRMTVLAYCQNTEPHLQWPIRCLQCIIKEVTEDMCNHQAKLKILKG